MSRSGQDSQILPTDLPPREAIFLYARRIGRILIAGTLVIAVWLYAIALVHVTLVALLLWSLLFPVLVLREIYHLAYPTEQGEEFRALEYNTVLYYRELGYNRWVVGLRLIQWRAAIAVGWIRAWVWTLTHRQFHRFHLKVRAAYAHVPVVRRALLASALPSLSVLPVLLAVSAATRAAVIVWIAQAVSLSALQVLVSLVSRYRREPDDRRDESEEVTD